MLKTCRICKKPKDIEQFRKVKRWRRGNCEPCRRRDSNERALKSAYGISSKDKKAMYKKQRGLCAACGLPLPKNFSKAHVDHDHETGQVRELLHHRCNWVMGYEENYPGILAAVLLYKKKWLDKNK